MVDPVTVVVEKVVEEVVQRGIDSVATQLGYIRNYTSNFKNLDRQVEKLHGKRESVQHRVDEAERNGEEIEQLVRNWLDRVETMIKEAKEIVVKNMTVNNKCFKSLCPNFKNRYLHSKEAAAKANDVLQLHDEGNFDKISYRTLPAERWLPVGYENIESRQSILKRVLHALQDSDVNMVGVHGIGGSGKTTLAREVAKKVEEEKLFGKVVFVEVSDTVDILRIQQRIAERLGLEFHEKDATVRADRLRQRIENEGEKRTEKENKILLILDNIWKDLDLAAVGIPFGDKGSQCKLLLTSRDLKLLKEMGSEPNFRVETLEEEEALNLFMKIADVGKEQRDLGSLAIDVAKECGGLLVAIATIANALKGEEHYEWRIALRHLKNPPSLENMDDSDSVVKKAYACIRLSYNKLASEELKSTFLLCSIMRYTHDVSIEELLRYGMGMDLFKGDKLEDVRDKVKQLVRKLKDSSLLLGSRNNETFSIHDVVLDVGRWIASSQHKLTLIHTIPQHWADDKWRNCTSITLHDIDDLPLSLKCPQLEFLCMKTRTPWSKIDEMFFSGMPNLKVLHVIEMDLSPLPASLCSLKKLQTLYLDWCRLGHMANIEHMKTLEILVISFEDGFGINYLPMEIGQLINLRSLDLKNCSLAIPPNTISRLTKLEELYLGDNWCTQQQVDTEGIACLAELKDLSHLTALDICVKDVQLLPEGLVFQNLIRYKIFIGPSGAYTFMDGETSRALLVSSDTHICGEDGVIRQLKGNEELSLAGKQRVNNVLPELDEEGFPQLKHFRMTNNPYIRFIVDSMPSPTRDAFPLLEILILSSLTNLEKICPDQLTSSSFCKLRIIDVMYCNELKNLFSLSIAKHLSQLQEIRVCMCSNMKKIFIDDKADNGVIYHSQISSLALEELSSLRRISAAEEASTPQGREMPSTTDASSSEIVSEDQTDTLPLFDEKVVFHKLKDLSLDDVNVKRIWPDQLPSLSSWVQNLTRLSLWNCHYLTYLFSSSTLGNFVQLQRLSIIHCSQMKELIRIDNKSSNYVEFPSLEELYIDDCDELGDYIFSNKVLFPNLQTINIENVKNLKMIWQSQLTESVQYCAKLREVNIYGVENLEYVFPVSIARNLLKLEKFSVKCCGIKTIVAKEERTEATARFVFPQLTSLRLCDLRELECFYPAYHTTEWPKLNELDLADCMKYEKEGQLDGVPAVQQPLFLVDKAFSSLERVTCNGYDTAMILQNLGPNDFFPKIKFLEVHNDNSAVFPLGILEIFYGVEDIVIEDCSYKEIFSYKEVDKYSWAFDKLRSLNLERLYDLKRMSRQDCNMDGICQKLEFLEVSWCCRLISLMPHSTTFENLKILKLYQCNKLKSLVAISTANSMIRLEEMSISHCSGMTEIIANEGDVMEGKITFSELKSLELAFLANLTIFCSGNYTFNFPLLGNLYLIGCSKMKFFSLGDLSMPKLQQVLIDHEYYDCEHVDLNTFLKQILDEKEMEESEEEDETEESSEEEDETEESSVEEELEEV